MYPNLNQNERELVQNLLELTYSLGDYENTVATFDPVVGNGERSSHNLAFIFDDNMNMTGDLNSSENVSDNNPLDGQHSVSPTIAFCTDPRKYSIRVSVDSSAHVSYIVGKQGTKIRQIRHETGTFIQTPVNGEEPVFVISGDRGSVEKAKKKILEASKEYDFKVFAEACTYKDGNRIRNNLFLPARYIGLVVGRKGSMIKRIMEVSGTSIITPKVNTENCFKIHGRPSQIRSAINLIKSHILYTSKVTVREIKQNQFEYKLDIKSVYAL